MKFCGSFSFRRFLLLNCAIFVVLFDCAQCKYEHLIHAQKLGKYNCSTLCNNIDCEEVKNCFGEVIVPNESYCGCCPVCVKFLDIDAQCEETYGSLRKVATSRCKKGSKCVNNKCVLDYNGNLNSCLIQCNLRELKRGKYNYTDDLWVPECDARGVYEAKQRKNIRNICVDEYGNKIFGNGDYSEKYACDCSRHMQTMLWENPHLYNIRPQEHCTPSGNFDKIQCINNLCFCADERGETIGRLVRKDSLDKLPCYDYETTERTYLKPCEVELQRSRHLTHEFRLKGVELVGVDGVKCDPDGSFSPTQCQPDRCVCTNKDGVGIGSYAISTEDLEKLKNIVMTCNCAREGASAQSTFKCKGFGNYAHLQCFNSEQCNCVDDDGDIVSKPLPRATTTEDYCINLLQGLVDPEVSKGTTVTDIEETDYEYYFAKEYI